MIYIFSLLLLLKLLTSGYIIFIFLNSLLLKYGSVLKNIAYISRNYRISYLNIFEKERRKFYLNIPHDELWLIKWILELLEIKDQNLFTILNESKVNFMYSLMILFINSYFYSLRQISWLYICIIHNICSY